MTSRVDQDGAAFAGSQLQTQLYVNRRSGELDAAIRAEFPVLANAKFEWRSPLIEERYAEYSDAAFLEQVELAHHAADLKAFWPSGGPHWDALSVVKIADSDRPGVILVEGKSYPDELYGGGCKAKEGSMSRSLIERSLGWTQQRLGVTSRTPTDWCGPLYQSANRLAHLCWLESLGVRAWLVHLLFVDDPHGSTSADQWEPALESANSQMGIGELGVPSAGHVLLEAGSREELLRDL